MREDPTPLDAIELRGVDAIELRGARDDTLWETALDDELAQSDGNAMHRASMELVADIEDVDRTELEEPPVQTQH